MARTKSDVNLDAETYSTSTELIAPQRIVICIHGIRTNAEWVDVLTHGRESWHRQIKAIKISPGYINTPMLLTRIGLRFRIDEVKDDLFNAVIKYRDCELSIIAHSMGSAILSEIIHKVDFRFKRIIFLGAICHRKHAQNISERCDLFINDCGGKDIFPILAETIRPDKYSHTGVYGFNKGRFVLDRKFGNDHFNCTSEGHVRDYIIGPIIGNEPIMPAMFHQQFSIGLVQSAMVAARLLLVACICLAIWIFYRLL